MKKLTRRQGALLPFCTVAVVGLLLGTSRLTFGPVFIPSGSMVPTLETGDIVLVNRMAYGTGVAWGERAIFEWSQPKRGDVVVFKRKEGKDVPVRAFIKRVVGVAGDTVSVRNHQLTLNGVSARYVKGIKDTLTEEGIGLSHGIQVSGVEYANFGPVTVPTGKVFVMGDNRGASVDSRAWGMLGTSSIEGKATSLKIHKNQQN